MKGEFDGAWIECPTCNETTEIDGEPCGDCGGRGRFLLNECPRRFVGYEITEAVNILSMCGDGCLPVAGGLLDQSSWLLSVWQHLRNEENRIDTERMRERS